MVSLKFLVLLIAAQILPEEGMHTFQKVQLQSSLPIECVSLPDVVGISLVLDRKDVEDMARLRMKHWKTEEERMQLIRSIDAQDLLKNLSGRRDSLDCEILDMGAAMDNRALLQLVNIGHARAWDRDSRSLLSHLERIDSNVDCINGKFGFYTFRKPGGVAFMFIHACNVSSH